MSNDENGWEWLVDAEVEVSFFSVCEEGWLAPVLGRGGSKSPLRVGRGMLRERLRQESRGNAKGIIILFPFQCKCAVED